MTSSEHLDLRLVDRAMKAILACAPVHVPTMASAQALIAAP